MILKKIFLIAFIGFIPVQSLALTDGQKIGLGCAIGTTLLCGAICGGIFYCDQQKKHAEQESWKNKTDEEMAALVTKFINKVERRLSFQLKKLRSMPHAQGDYTIKGNLKCFYFIPRAINKCDVWLNRLQNREISHVVTHVTQLRSELVELNDKLNVYIDKDFIKLFESLKNQPTPVIVTFINPCCR